MELRSREWRGVNQYQGIQGRQLPKTDHLDVPLALVVAGMVVDGMVTSQMVPAWNGLPWALTLTPCNGVMAEVPILSLFMAL